MWQSGLTAEQRNRLESIQRRVLYIISNSHDYELQCVLYDIEPISVRLDNVTRTFFAESVAQAIVLIIYYRARV